jgi:hypothetical protein
MEIVLYTDDMEPITVIDIPVEYHKLALNGRFVIPLIEPMSAVWDPDAMPAYLPMKTVNVWAEQFTRQGRTHLFFFTHDEEFALALKAEMLAGQRKELMRAFQDGVNQTLGAILARMPR